MKKQALLVEDDPFMRESVHAFLGDMGYDVAETASYSEARKWLDLKPRPNLRLAVFDILLPYHGRDEQHTRRPLGLDLCQYSKEVAPHCAVLLWSAYSHYAGDIARMAARGITGLGFASKGSRMSTIQEIIDRIRQGDVVIRVMEAGQRTQTAEHMLMTLEPALAAQVRQVQQSLKRLSPRQEDVVRLLPRSPQAIAETLCLALPTVRNYLDAAYSNLGLRNTAGAETSYRRESVIVLACILDDLLHQPEI